MNIVLFKIIFKNQCITVISLSAVLGIVYEKAVTHTPHTAFFPFVAYMGFFYRAMTPSPAGRCIQSREDDL